LYRISFLAVRRPGRGVDHPPSSSAEVKERVELYLSSPSEPSLPVLVCILPFKACSLVDISGIDISGIGISVIDISGIHNFTLKDYRLFKFPIFSP
jgi:hypothetical protein